MSTIGSTMNTLGRLLSLCILVAPLALAQLTYECPNSKTNPLVRKGKRFYDSVTGAYFPIKGVAYYPRPNAGELSANPSVDYYTEDYRVRWEEDIEHFKNLNINALRIYAVDPSQWHESFMCALQEAGIYVIIGLLASCLDCGIGATSTNDSPPLCYSQTLKERGQFIITTFSKYANTLAFSAGNEATIFARDRMSNAPCQKKFIRDMRHFVNSCSADSEIALTPTLARQVPIGVVGWDNDDITRTQEEYFGCQSDPNDPLEPMEWYGINTYRHCDANAESVADLGGFERLKNTYIDMNLEVPIVLAEYGCRAKLFPTLTSENTGEEFDSQRTWLQLDMLYSTPEYLDVFAGGTAYEFSAEKVVVDRSLDGNPWPYYGFMSLNYGMGYMYPEDCDNIQNMCKYEPYPESKLFGEKMAAVDTSFIPSMNEPSDQIPGAIPDCPVEYPPLSDFVWPTDENDEAILACTTSSTLAPTTMAPTTVPPTTPETTAPTDGVTEQTTDAPTPGDVTLMPTTIQPTAPSGASPVAPSATTDTFTPTLPTDQPPIPTAEVQELCIFNPTCAAQNALQAAGVESCCPTKDNRNLFLDCCAAVEDFCTDEAGTLIVCQRMSSTQYVNEVLTGQRDPNAVVTNSNNLGSGAVAATSTRAAAAFVASLGACWLGSLVLL